MFIHVSSQFNRAVTHLTDKDNERRTDRINANNVYPVMEVVLVTANVEAEVARSAYVPSM